MQATTSPPSGPRAGRRECLGLAVLALPTLLLALDVSVPIGRPEAGQGGTILAPVGAAGDHALTPVP